MKGKRKMAPCVAALLLAACGSADEGASGSANKPAESKEIVAATPAKPPEAPAKPAPGSYPPRDDCSRQAGWADFRARLADAVARRDADLLVSLTDPEVHLDFGGGSGTDELRKRLDAPNYRLWDELAAILPLGCGFADGSAAMPWIFLNAPATADPYATMWVIGSGVPVREAASATARQAGKLDWAAVTAGPYTQINPEFLKVTDPETKLAGYVDTKSLRSLIDYRLIAQGKGGKWRITVFIAGD
jgi:hypothetical protein